MATSNGTDILTRVRFCVRTRSRSRSRIRFRIRFRIRDRDRNRGRSRGRNPRSAGERVTSRSHRELGGVCLALPKTSLTESQ